MSLDVNDPEAEPVALTSYTPNNREQIDSMAYPDDGSWVAYIELNGNDGLIKQIDLATGEISTLFECDTELIEGCWLLDVSPNGRYMVFGGLAKNLPGAEVAWLIDLEDDSIPPTLLEDGGTAPATFVNNEAIAYWTFESDTVVIYDIASSDIRPTDIHEYEPRFSPDGSIFADISVFADAGEIGISYTIINFDNNTEHTFDSLFGNRITAWHPDNRQFLTRSIRYGEPKFSQIVLIDSSTGEGQILVEQAGFEIIDMAWNPDGTQFLFWRHAADEGGYEGDIWVYDMETNDARSLNEVGSNVGWLN